MFSSEQAAAQKGIAEVVLSRILMALPAMGNSYYVHKHFVITFVICSFLSNYNEFYREERLFKGVDAMILILYILDFTSLMIEISLDECSRANIACGLLVS